jgi:hypothetical protein
MLCACSGGNGYENGSGSVSAVCSYIYGGGTTTLVTSGCATCTVTDEAAAIDGNPETFATITYPVGVQGTMALRATAQNGVVYPSGSAAGVLLSRASSGQSLANNDFDLRTYLNGTLAGSTVKVAPSGLSGPNSSGRYRVDFAAPAQFDAVELGYSNGASVGAVSIRVHEFCNN